MPYTSIAQAKSAGFPITVDGIDLTISQVNRLSKIYDGIKKAGTASNPMAAAWTQWKKLYKKSDNHWIEIKAAAIQFGTESFTAAASNNIEGVPDHAAMIEGRLIHLNTKNLNGWGVTTAAAENIIKSIPGIPIRACPSLDPHECDYVFDNKSHIGYGVKAWIEDGWIHVAAAITDKEAANHIIDGTWTPLGKGSWSVAGFPIDDGVFEKTGLISDYQPTGISLVFAPAIPAFIGSGFDMVAAAVSNHIGDIMTETKPGGGTDPVMYNQDALDTAVKDALEQQKNKIAAAGKEDLAAGLAKQKIEYEANLQKMTTEERGAYDIKLAEMTPTVDVEKMIAAAVTQGQADTIEAMEITKLASEYQKLLTASIIGAPFQTDGKLDQTKVDAKMTEVSGMKSAAIAGMINEAKLLIAAAEPAISAFNGMDVPGRAPGTLNQDAQDMATCDRMLGEL